MTRAQALTLCLTALGGAALAHTSQRQVDAARRDLNVSHELLFIPDAESVRVAALDHSVHVADILWVRSVLAFGERWNTTGDPAWVEWLSRTVLGICQIDPRWRTPYFYGGVMLRVLGDYEGSTTVMKLGSENLPNDPWFPFSVGMNLYIQGGDREEAARWVAEAARRPGAPEWYAVAAVAFRQEKKERPQAIRFLQDELKLTDDPKLREELERRLASLTHDEYAERLNELAGDLAAERGRPTRGVEELVRAGKLKTTPPDPLGGSWIRDVDGRIKSSVRAAQEKEQALRVERQMLERGEPVEAPAP
ncbi:tetratricopeptide repeat protein [Myxococcota bacterium]|nr:tetratricopeptide repeat protein [Myxococcota bacterium]